MLGPFQIEFLQRLHLWAGLRGESARMLPSVSPAGARPLHSGNMLTVIDTDGDGNKEVVGK